MRLAIALSAEIAMLSRVDLLYVPQVLATLSLLYFAATWILSAIEYGKENTGQMEGARTALDGMSIFAFRLSRLLLAFGLLSLEVFTASSNQGPLTSHYQPLFYVSRLSSRAALELTIS